MPVKIIAKLNVYSLSRSFPPPLAVRVLPDAVIELGLTVDTNAVRVSLTVMMFHWTLAVCLTASSEVFPVTSQNPADFDVPKGRLWKTNRDESCFLLQLNEDKVLTTSRTIAFLFFVIVRVKGPR